MRQTLVQQLPRLPTTLLPIPVIYLMQRRNRPLVVIPKGEHVNERPIYVMPTVAPDHGNAPPDAKVTSFRALAEELGEALRTTVSVGPFHRRRLVGHVAGIVLGLQARLAQGGGCCVCLFVLRVFLRVRSSVSVSVLSRIRSVRVS